MEKPHAITRFFGSGTMTKLGALAFPMFILHGPLGQIFYKKPLALKGYMMYDILYIVRLWPKEDRREALGWDHAKEVLSALPPAGDACWSLHQRVLCRRLRTNELALPSTASSKVKSKKVQQFSAFLARKMANVTKGLRPAKLLKAFESSCTLFLTLVTFLQEC